MAGLTGAVAPAGGCHVHPPTHVGAVFAANQPARAVLAVAGSVAEDAAQHASLGSRPLADVRARAPFGPALVGEGRLVRGSAERDQPLIVEMPIRDARRVVAP